MTNPDDLRDEAEGRRTMPALHRHRGVRPLRLHRRGVRTVWGVLAVPWRANEPGNGAGVPDDTDHRSRRRE